MALTLRDPFLSRWFFDVELIGRFVNLRRAAGDASPEHRIVEVPLEAWIDVAGSKLKALDFVRASWELAGIWWRLRTAHNRHPLPETPSPRSAGIPQD